VRRRYRYDPSYLEQPELASWLAELTRGQPNAHLAALHAGRDAQVLGRGVCYDLNVLLCELLRRSGIPAAVATGWVLDGGSLADPDHLWSMALLPTPEGPRWLPLDASTTEQGRPLRVSRRPPGTWRAPASHGVTRSRITPDWARRATQQGGAGLERVLAVRELPWRELQAVVRHLEQSSGQPPRDERALQEQLQRLFSDPERLRALLALLSGG
jgi:transglutaminase-like putative cysteine protease